MVKKCNTCKIEKELSNFHKASKSSDGYRFICKACRKIYSAERFKNKRLDHYVVYYIPSHHYVGMTNEPGSRMQYHKGTGKNVDEYKVLYACECRKEAKYHEALFQSVLGMEGLSMT